MANDLEGTLTGYKNVAQDVIGGFTRGATAVGSVIGGLSGPVQPSGGLASQGYNRNGEPPAMKVNQTPTGELAPVPGTKLP
jgi:hypothetical protein